MLETLVSRKAKEPKRNESGGAHDVSYERAKPGCCEMPPEKKSGPLVDGPESRELGTGNG